jgi:hypothetical protein
MTRDRRTVVLGLVAVGAVAAAVTVTVFRQDAKGSPQRRAVRDYIQRVNAIQNRMHAPLSRVMLAYRDFTGQGTATRDPGPELAAAAATLADLDHRLAVAPAPPQARTLRLRLLELVAGQAAVTREVQRLSAFSPAYGAVLRTARAANTRLERALQSVAVPKAHALKGTKQQVRNAQRWFQLQAAAAAAGQADAIDAYALQVGAVLRTLVRLRPPAVLRPTWSAQIRAFREIRRTATALTTQLRKPTRGDVATLGRAFAASSRIAQSTAAQRAQIAAIEEYNARARALSSAALRVRSELLRLQRTLP